MPNKDPATLSNDARSTLRRIKIDQLGSISESPAVQELIDTGCIDVIGQMIGDRAEGHTEKYVRFEVTRIGNQVGQSPELMTEDDDPPK